MRKVPRVNQRSVSIRDKTPNAVRKVLMRVSGAAAPRPTDQLGAEPIRASRLWASKIPSSQVSSCAIDAASMRCSALPTA